MRIPLKVTEALHETNTSGPDPVGSLADPVQLSTALPMNLSHFRRCYKCGSLRIPMRIPLKFTEALHGITTFASHPDSNYNTK